MLPRCPCCEDLSRPNVSMFGDTNSVRNSPISICYSNPPPYKIALSFVLQNFNSSRTHKQQAALMRWMRMLQQHVGFPFSFCACFTYFFFFLQGKRIAVLEIGCGVSIHSLRIEAEALIQLHPNISLVRHYFYSNNS